MNAKVKLVSNFIVELLLQCLRRVSECIMSRIAQTRSQLLLQIYSDSCRFELYYSLRE